MYQSVYKHIMKLSKSNFKEIFSVILKNTCNLE